MTCGRIGAVARRPHKTRATTREQDHPWPVLPKPEKSGAGRHVDEVASLAEALKYSQATESHGSTASVAIVSHRLHRSVGRDEERRWTVASYRWGVCMVLMTGRNHRSTSSYVDVRGLTTRRRAQRERSHSR